MKLLKGVILGIGLLLAGTIRAYAASEVFESASSSATLSATVVRCSTGTAIRIDNLSRPAGTHAWIRLQNQCGSVTWIGFNSSVSTDTASGFLGEALASGTPGGSASYPIGRDIQLWCKAADAAGANGCPLSKAAFGAN